MNLTTAFTLAKFDLVKSYLYRTVPGPATPCTGTESPLYRDRQVHRYSRSVQPCHAHTHHDCTEGGNEPAEEASEHTALSSRPLAPNLKVDMELEPGGGFQRVAFIVPQAGTGTGGTLEALCFAIIGG